MAVARLFPKSRNLLLHETEAFQSLGNIGRPDAPRGTVSKFHHIASVVLFDLRRCAPGDGLEHSDLASAQECSLLEQCSSSYSVGARMR